MSGLKNKFEDLKNRIDSFDGRAEGISLMAFAAAISLSEGIITKNPAKFAEGVIYTSIAVTENKKYFKSKAQESQLRKAVASENRSMSPQ